MLTIKVSISVSKAYFTSSGVGRSYRKNWQAMNRYARRRNFAKRPVLRRENWRLMKRIGDIICTEKTLREGSLAKGRAEGEAERILLKAELEGVQAELEGVLPKTP